MTECEPRPSTFKALGRDAHLIVSEDYGQLRVVVRDSRGKRELFVACADMKDAMKLSYDQANGFAMKALGKQAPPKMSFPGTRPQTAVPESALPKFLVESRATVGYAAWVPSVVAQLRASLSGSSNDDSKKLQDSASQVEDSKSRKRISPPIDDGAPLNTSKRKKKAEKEDRDKPEEEEKERTDAEDEHEVEGQEKDQDREDAATSARPSHIDEKSVDAETLAALGRLRSNPPLLTHEVIWCVAEDLRTVFHKLQLQDPSPRNLHRLWNTLNVVPSKRIAYRRIWNLFQLLPPTITCAEFSRFSSGPSKMSASRLIKQSTQCAASHNRICTYHLTIPGRFTEPQNDRIPFQDGRSS